MSLPKPLRDLRRLIYCGEWIESHALHVYMLHAPDFLGFEGAIDMARAHLGVVERGLALKKLLIGDPAGDGRPTLLERLCAHEQSEVQLAWRFLDYQGESALARWFRARKLFECRTLLTMLELLRHEPIHVGRTPRRLTRITAPQPQYQRRDLLALALEVLLRSQTGAREIAHGLMPHEVVDA